MLRWPASCEAGGGWELIELEEVAVYEMHRSGMVRSVFPVIRIYSFRVLFVSCPFVSGLFGLGCLNAWLGRPLFPFVPCTSVSCLLVSGFLSTFRAKIYRSVPGHVYL